MNAPTRVERVRPETASTPVTSDSLGYHWGRRLFLLLAAYLTLLGGSPYYLTIFPIRVLHHIVMTGLLAGWLIHRLRMGRGLPRTPLDGVLAAVALLSWIAMVFSRDPRISFEALWFPLQFLLAFYVMAALIMAGRTRLLLEAQFLMGGIVVIVAAMQLASWWFGLNLVPDTHVGWSAAFARGVLPLESPLLFLPLGVTTWLAAYAAPLALFAAVKALTEKQRDLKVALLVLALLLVMIMLLTGSRGGVISLGVGSALLILLRILSSSAFRRMRRAYQVLFVLLPALLFVVLGAGVLFWTQTRADDGSDILRLGLWRGAVTMINQSPLIGVGPGMFGRVYREVRDPQFVDDRLGTAHNVFLNTAAETGIGGALLLVGLSAIVVSVWWRRWRRAQGQERLRLEGAISALAGLSVHSQFDLFTATPIMLLMVLLTAYICIAPNSPPPEVGSRTRQAAAGAALIIIVAYGLLLLNWDRAHGMLLASIRAQPSDDALALADEAAAVDPGLRLYPLWAAYLRGDRQSLIDALALEPTWDVGWIRLAEIEERAGNLNAALAALEQLRDLSRANPGSLHWARLAEQLSAAPESEIVDVYRETIPWAGPPLSDFWGETPLRRRALLDYMARNDLDVQYRIAQVHFPDRLSAIYESALAAEDGPAWWVRGEQALTTGDGLRAAAMFEQATLRRPTNGDYRASLARALIASDRPADAEFMLLLAELLGTMYEYPNAIRAQMVDDQRERQRLWASALPPMFQMQNFEGVLFLGRTADFQIPAMYRFPGPGSRAMQPWYDLAQSYIDAGNLDESMRVLQAIIDYAPDEIRAGELLERLRTEGVRLS